MMIQSGRNIFHSFGVVFWTICLLFLLTGGGDVWGQRQRAKGNGRQDRAVAEEAKNVQKIVEAILSDYVSQNIPLTAEDVEEIEKELEHANRFRGVFNPEQKAYYFLVQAYLNHFSDKPVKDTILMAQKAHDLDPENEDITHSLIVLSLYHGKYLIAQKALREVKAGEEVVIDSNPEESDDKPLAGSAGRYGKNDPNSRYALNRSRNDPNSGPGWLTGKQQAGSEKKSKWAQRRRGTKQGQAGAGPGMMPGMMPGAQRGREPGMMPGMMPPGPGYQASAAARGRASKPAGRRHRRSSKVILKLPTEAMPYAHLGETFQSLNVRNVNGSTYQFESGQGQVLCAFLWTLPDDTGNQRPSTRHVKSTLQLDQMPVQDVAYDLWGNVDQLRELYRFHRKSGKAQFVTINLDRATGRNVDRVQELFLDSSWPWVNFMAKDTAQVSPWKLKELYSQVFVIVDPQGVIRYMGPVGGFLPLMLLDAQLPQAQAGVQLLQFTQKPTAGQQQASKGFLKRLLDGGSSSTTPPSKSTVNPALRSPKNSANQPTSSHQAQQMLELAKVKKRVSLRGALNIYDDLLSQFSESEQAEIARMQIKSICRKNSRLKKERLKEGLYTGYE